MDKNAIPGAHAIIVTPDHKIVLQQKTQDYVLNPQNCGKLSMYGGGMEGNEEPLAALRRELKEELQLDIDDYSVQKLNQYKKTKEQDGIDADVYVYVLKDVDPTTLSINTEDSIEGTAGLVIDTVENFLKNPLLTRITKLALEDFKAR